MTVCTSAGEVRKELYAYLEAVGLKVTDEVHRRVRAFMMEHTMHENARLRKERDGAIDALHNISVMPKMKTILSRLNSGHCPACGIICTVDEHGQWSSACKHV